jgi:protein-tyrosine phosphatase
MASFIRQIVAFPFSWCPEYGLDFSYVTSQIIVLSGPTSTYPQRAYRNPINKLVKFLDNRHGQDWVIWEFRAEGTGYFDDKVSGRVNHFPWPDHQPPPFGLVPIFITSMSNWLNTKEERLGEDQDKGRRVAVLHCRAGKGRSGTMTCSYLISECGWGLDQALARFTERRMRSGFGEGVSIPSQLRWVGYVDRWKRHGKLYAERKIEIKEVRVWGIKDSVEVSIKGYADAGKVMHTFHTFTNQERIDTGNFGNGNETRIERYKERGWKTPQPEFDAKHSVVFKPAMRITLLTSDVNISFKRYIQVGSNFKIPTSMAHIWFNAFFEGNGPENNGEADEGGVFEIDWDEMDGIYGFMQKGTRALHRIAVVWKAHDPAHAVEDNE